MTSSSSSTLLLSPEELPQLFADVSPVSQPPSPGGVCEIQYADGFVTAYDYFRAVAPSREVSDRVLRLTELCATLNPANYTVWQHRRFVWRQLLLIAVDSENTMSDHVEASTAATAAAAAAVVEDADVDDDDDDANPSASRTLLRARVEYELQLASRLGGANPKTYQIWYHRRAIVEHLHELASTDDSVNDDIDENDGDDNALLLLLKERIDSELEYLRTVARADGKNYHAWSYRQFLLLLMRKVPTVRPSEQGTDKADYDDDDDDDDDDNVWSKELEYASELLDDDCRNNSAWNHRWFVLVMSDAGATSRRTTVEAPGATAVLDEHVVAREVRYALEVARIDPHNESPWRFFVALVRHHVRGLLLMVVMSGDDDGNSNNDKTIPPIGDVLDMYEQQAWGVMPGASDSVRAAFRNGEKEEGADDTTAPPLSRDVVSPHLVAAVVDLLELSLSSPASGSGGEAGTAASLSEVSSRARAVHLCTCLEEIDPIRQKYWRYRAVALQRGASPNDDNDVNVVEEPGRKQ
jgi:protein farnesyltransferase/geranylgeranyltransferase type-1 subunit alpha